MPKFVRVPGHLNLVLETLMPVAEELKLTGEQVIALVSFLQVLLSSASEEEIESQFEDFSDKMRDKRDEIEKKMREILEELED